MILADGKEMFFSDCALVPEPDAEGMASIAISTADTYKKLLGGEPTIAMLSFSTKGSGGNIPVVKKVQEATTIVKERAPELKVDGELQLDAAIVESVGSKKAPGSDVAGKADTLIFPDLNAANIGYNLFRDLPVQKLSGLLYRDLQSRHLIFHAVVAHLIYIIHLLLQL